MLPNIPPDQQSNYTYAFEALMDSYGISEDHRKEFQEMLYYFVLKFESANNIIYEHKQAVNALSFFRDYLSVKSITVNEFNRKNTNMPDTYDSLTECLTVQIHGKFQKAKAVLDYYGIGLDTVNFLYNKIKNTDHILNRYLKDHPNIPPADAINSFIEELELKSQDGFLEDIREIAGALNEYLDHNLSDVVSRHKYHLIFDLLYLCDVFKYIKHINKHEGKYYSIDHRGSNDNPYLAPKKIADGDKYKVINGLFKNEERSKSYKEKTLKAMREK